MTDTEIRTEICKAFVKQMGLTTLALEQGELFPFRYLQRTGAGSRTLCVPSVSDSFEWCGRQVSTLAKSGGMIYILAEISLLLELDEVHFYLKLGDPKQLLSLEYTIVVLQWCTGQKIKN